MRTTSLVLAPCLVASAIAAQTGGWRFTDDFESGAIDYDNWNRGGRDLSGTGVVNVVSRGDSLAGHVYHRSFTEATLWKDFELTPAFSLDFDMEVRAADPGTPGWTYYSMAGAWIEVFGPVESGRLEVIYSTSGYRQALFASDPKVEVLPIPQGVRQHHHYTLADILSYLPGVDPAGITTLRLDLWSYCSWWNGNATSDVWIDNVEARNIAATLAVNPDPPLAGAFATFTVTGFDPQRSAFLFLSTQGLGSTPLPFLGLNLGIASAHPAVLLGRIPPGKASWPMPIPVSAAGQTWWMQAAQQGRSTRVLTLTVL